MAVDFDRPIYFGEFWGGIKRRMPKLPKPSPGREPPPALASTADSWHCPDRALHDRRGPHMRRTPTMMTRAKGRPRKSGARYPGGQLRQELPGALLRRVLDHAKDARIGSQLGRLALSHEISTRQFEAGVTFARLFDDYARIMGFPPRTASGIDLNRVPGKGLAEVDQKRVSAVRGRYEAARNVLEAVGATEIVVSVCVDDEAPLWGEKSSLLCGLSALATAFFIDKSPRG